MVAQKLMDEHKTDSPQTLTSISDEDITVLCKVIGRLGG